MDRVSDAARRANGPAEQGRPAAPARPQGGTPFAAALEAAGGDGVRFSGHALQRIERRDIEFGVDRLARLEDAVAKADAKGSKESLILIDELALVVSVRNRTVITAMDANSRKENVFTNIDSVVIN